MGVPSRETKPHALDFTQTHKDLIEQCKRGDRRAQQQLYQHYARQMYNICLRMLRHEHDAEDLLQQSFMDAFSKLPSFRYESSFGAWLKRIVVNNCINFLKRKRLSFTFLDEVSESRLAHDAEPDSPDDEDIPLEVQRIYEAMKQLPDGYRLVFSLYLIEGYDHREIADILGITEATSKSQYHRAKKKVKEILCASSKVAEGK